MVERYYVNKCKQVELTNPKEIFRDINIKYMRLLIGKYNKETIEIIEEMRENDIKRYLGDEYHKAYLGWKNKLKTLNKFR